MSIWTAVAFAIVESLYFFYNWKTFSSDVIEISTDKQGIQLGVLL